mmetsp:Transcript_13207/g.37686  ORF Transcript_13207/g.37686 Transcript_13207/m.37686 type:complete len:223 (-) Transcript_13207:475-1143(-)
MGLRPSSGFCPALTIVIIGRRFIIGATAVIQGPPFLWGAALLLGLIVVFAFGSSSLVGVTTSFGVLDPLPLLHPFLHANLACPSTRGPAPLRTGILLLGLGQTTFNALHHLVAPVQHRLARHPGHVLLRAGDAPPGAGPLRPLAGGEGGPILGLATRGALPDGQNRLGHPPIDLCARDALGQPPLAPLRRGVHRLRFGLLTPVAPADVFRAGSTATTTTCGG